MMGSCLDAGELGVCFFLMCAKNCSETFISIYKEILNDSFVGKMTFQLPDLISA